MKLEASRIQSPSLDGGDDYHTAPLLLPDGRYAFIMPLTFGRARIGVSGSPGDQVFQDVW